MSTSAGTPVPSSDYRMAAPLVIRVMGVVAVLGGLVVSVVALLVAVFPLPGAVLSVAVAVAGAGVVLGLASVFWLWRHRPVVHLDADGYVVRWVRGVGVPAGRWADVEEVAATTVGGERVLELRRRDGTTTTIPVGILDRSGDDLAHEVGQRLSARGRRRR